MKRDVATNNRIGQLPMCISGIFYNVFFNGIAMPFFTHTVERRREAK